jgi:peptidoglycan hydrolase-like protein with peptidoglycan-binding domain
MKTRRALLIACVLAGFGSATGCGGRSIEDRAREAAEKAKDTSFGPDFEALAIAQPIDPAVAKEVQENLTTIHEYQGEIGIKFDSVTVNAIQAFQRSANLKDDGIVDERTRTALQTAANAAKQGGAAAGAH